MPKSERYSDYDDFAWAYNKHWGGQFTPAAFAVLEKLVFPKIAANARILDLCCGTGQKTQLLAQRGYVMTGLDGSEEMLKFARENAPSTHFILGDARTFKLPAEYDVVVSMFDSLNHVMTNEELTAVFRNVWNCLKAGGLLQFDMNLEPGYLKTWHGYNGIIEEDHVCIFPNSYDAEKRTARMDCTIFRLESGRWRRTDFTLTQKCYSHEELLSALRKAGFASIEDFSYDRVNGLAALTPASMRVFFLCQK
jgi:SAM-dependent methyltransferase